MAKSKNKTPKGDKACQKGYVSFTPEDLKQQALQDAANAKAYDLLDQAMVTSSHVTAASSKHFKEGGTVDIDDVYPITLEETQEMEQLLNQAEEVAGNPSEPFFAERLRELRYIIYWSKKRHWNFSWSIIIGVLITVWFLSYQAGEKEKRANSSEVLVSQVESWSERDTTVTMREEASAHANKLFDERFHHANAYKAYILNQEYGRNYYSYVQSANNYKAKADTASVAAQKKDFLKWAKESEESAKVYLKGYEKLNAMSYKEVKKMALNEVKGQSKSAKSSARTVLFWNIFFLLLIPVYIFADRPYGYMLSRTRTEARVLGGIKKWGFALAGGIVGIAAGIGFVDVVTKWSDGTTTREDDGSGPLRLGFKILLLAAALILFCAISCFLMLYTTVQGLRRNFDWKSSMATVNAMANKAKIPS